MSRTKTALRNRRKVARKEALAAISGLSDDDLRNVMHELGREYSEKANVLNEVRVRLDVVKNEIERRVTMTISGFHISDHAVLRYLERHEGVDMKEVREKIVSMAKRSGKMDSGRQYARCRDDETGLTLGVNEITNTVTTVFSEQENAVMETQ